LLRLLLGAYLDADPRTLGFRTGEYGKPRLAGADGRLRFNLSHSGGVAVYAVALGVEVGVDVQTRRHRPPTLAVAERAFGRAEAVRLARLAEAEREREFLRLWVCHEAGLKCLGVGLAGSEAAAPAQRPRTKEPERPWARELYLGARWSVAGAVAAVAAIEEPVSVRRRLVAHVSPIDRPPHPGDTADQA
jgi:4'-phosphopantetheinyl transferase